MLRNIVIVLSSGVVALVVACGSESSSEFDTSDAGHGGDGGTGTFNTADVGPAPPPVECKKMDIVFVIDDSPSMKEEQANLGKNFPEFHKVINEYKTAKGDLLEYRVAITSTDDTGKNSWDQGRFTKSYGAIPPEEACDPGPPNNPWLVREDPNIATNFACRAHLGIVGSNLERPLESAKLALIDRIADGTNTMDGESFIREDALLAFVIITDEDEGGADGDPSNTPSPRQNAPLYATDFDKIKGGYRGRWAAAVIAGDRQCVSSELGEAADAVRLKSFVSAAGSKNAIFSSICEGDLTKGLKDALNLFTAACKEFPGVK